MGTLRTEKITKEFPGVVALNDLSLEFQSGKIHAIVGKNGSGKSTFLKILSGALKQTDGRIFLNGNEILINNPEDAFEKGIATVYQEFSLLPELSVAENIFMGRLPVKNNFIDWKKLYQDSDELLKELNVDIDSIKLIKELSVWQCQIIEIAKAMSHKPKVLLLDEPTSALANTETESLFSIIRSLKDKDVIIIYVSHRLHELWQIADICTVLRDGHVIGTTLMESLSREELLRLMFGDVKIRQRPSNLRISDEIVLEVKNLSSGEKFTNVSFSLHKGEILGIAGMLGSGRTELLRAIFGVDNYDTGEIIFKGNRVDSPNPMIMKNLGLALTSENRKAEGLIQILSIKENLCLASLRSHDSRLFVNSKNEHNMVAKQIEDLNISVSDVDISIKALSGGNQQKVVVGNWLNTNPLVILLDEPTRGIDVDAKQQIFEIIWDQSRMGRSIIMVSSELEELLEVCNRILILHNGKICGNTTPERINVEQLYTLCMEGNLQ